VQLAERAGSLSRGQGGLRSTSECGVARSCRCCCCQRHQGPLGASPRPRATHRRADPQGGAASAALGASTSRWLARRRSRSAQRRGPAFWDPLGGRLVLALNKLDVGHPARVMLSGRHDGSLLLVSYKDLKAVLNKSFGEVVASVPDEGQ